MLSIFVLITLVFNICSLFTMLMKLFSYMQEVFICCYYVNDWSSLYYTFKMHKYLFMYHARIHDMHLVLVLFDFLCFP